MLDITGLLGLLRELRRDVSGVSLPPTGRGVALNDESNRIGLQNQKEQWPMCSELSMRPAFAPEAIARITQAVENLQRLCPHPSQKHRLRDGRAGRIHCVVESNGHPGRCSY